MIYIASHHDVTVSASRGRINSTLPSQPVNSLSSSNLHVYFDVEDMRKPKVQVMVLLVHYFVYIIYYISKKTTNGPIKLWIPQCKCKHKIGAHLLCS